MEKELLHISFKITVKKAGVLSLFKYTKQKKRQTAQTKPDDPPTHSTYTKINKDTRTNTNAV